MAEIVSGPWSDRQVISAGGGGGDDGMSTLEFRVQRLEEDVSAIKRYTERADPALASIQADLKHLASSSDIQGLRGDIGALTAKLDGKADASVVSELKGGVDKLPTIKSVTALTSALLGAYALIKVFGPFVARHLG